MTEIEYYGSTTSEKNPIHGATAKAWTNLQGAGNFLKGMNIRVPFCHVLTKDDALEVTSKTFTYPVRLWVSHDENTVYSGSHIANNSKEFRSVVIDAPEDSSIVVVRTTPSSADYTGVFSIYIAPKAVLIQIGYDGASVFPVSFDMTSLFGNGRLNQDYIYRLSHYSGDDWIVDEIIDGDNKFLLNAVGHNIPDAPESVFDDFRIGFLRGFGIGDLAHSGYLLSSFSHIGSNFRIGGDFNATGDSKIARTQGFILGQMLQNRLNSHFAHLNLNVGMKEKINLIAALDSTMVAQIQSLSDLHNAVVKSDKNALRSHIEKFFSGYQVLNANNVWNRVRAFVANYNMYFSYNLNGTQKGAKVLCAKISKFDDNAELLDLNVDIDFEVKNTFDFGQAQFRVLESSSGDLKIRFQSKTIDAKKVAVTNDGKSYTLKQYGTDCELSFSVDQCTPDLENRLASLTYNLGSNAGTNMKYAPCIIDGNMIVSKEDPSIVICSVKAVTTQLGF